MDHAPGRGVGAADGSSQQEELLRPGDSDQPGQQPGGPAVGGEAPLDEGQPEPAVLGRHGEVGRQGDLAAQPGRPALHGGDDRELDFEEEGDDAVRLQRDATLHASRARLLADALAATQSDPEQKSSPVLERTTTRRVSSVDAASSASTMRRAAAGVERALAFGPVDGDAQHASRPTRR